jgi:hypothetical protein
MVSRTEIGPRDALRARNGNAAIALIAVIVTIGRREGPDKGRERVMTLWFEPSAGAKLHALLAALRRSPIIVPIVCTACAALEWSRVRKSGNADAFVLAWIASHVHDRSRARRRLM